MNIIQHPLLKALLLFLCFMLLSVSSSGCADENSNGTSGGSTEEDGKPTEADSSDTSPSSIDLISDSGAQDSLDSSDTANPPLPEILPANEYCERTVDIFCDYYLRCGRMAASSVEECQGTFLEACQEVYQPHYEALAERGSLALSSAGIESCAAHLETVSCESQIFDLDGGCAEIWRGLDPVGAACAPGIESFVCAEGSTCVISLDFCGACEATSEVGGVCRGDTGKRCEASADCVDEVCELRQSVGESCTEDGVSCVSGAWCISERCTAPEIVGLGEACNQGRRCPYRSVCAGGFCEQTSLLGEACAGPGWCASGSCNDGFCTPLLKASEPCERAEQCLSRVCDETCQELPGACF